IGQSGDLTDWAPTTKRATSLSTIRGLPEEPGKEGSYTSAAVAYYGRTVGIPTVTGKPKQYVDTYVVALDSPLPKMEVTTSKGTITLVPFGKSVAGSGFNLDARKDYYQPANQIIKFYVDHLILSDPSKGIRYNAKFLISYEDSEEGGDYDMDFIVEYLIEETPEGDVNVTLTPRYFGAAITMNVGYTVSGAGTKDGPYLVVQDRSRDNQNRINPTYHLNVPDGRSVGYCDASKPGSNPSDPGCATLPACSTGTFGACTLNQKSVQRFTPSGGSAATLLKDPLWYAAKWGGFRGNPGDAQFWPNTPEKWDSTGGGQPDNYFPVRNALQLEKALVNAINAIRESGGKSSGRINTSSDILASGDTLVFNTTLTATSDPPDWSGDLVATAIIRVDKDNISGLGPVRWQAAEKLPAASARSIFTRNNANLLDIPSNGVEFKWEQLNSGQQTALTWDRKFDGSSVLDYVRGSAEKEISHSGIFRNRTRMGGALSPLGDSPNNTPRYFKATDTVYLGANDGMLHAFNGATGQELFAYIPSALIPKLPELAQSDYGHAWYVDGEATIGTIQESSVSVKHMLIAALGRGGKGLFGLDVTTPASFSASNVAWELNGPPVDQCKTTDDDANNIGLILGAPLIGTFNDGKTYAIVGNGYNSCRGRAVLYVIDIQTGNVVRRIDTSTATNNGLSTPVALDLDGDGKIDLVYAGDLLGNLWRFDMRSDKPADWRARLGRTSTTATAFFSAGSTKPITAPPAAILDSDGIPWVFFGTGRYLSIADKSNQDIQSWYGLMDNTDTNTTTITSAQLTQRKFESFGTTTLSNGRETTIRNVQKQAGTTDMVGKRGWYINFDVKSDAGERVISAPLIIKARHETVIEIPTIIPSSDPCLAGGRGYINFINAFTGAALEYAFIDLNGDGVVNSLDITGGSFPGSIDLQDAMPGNLAIVGEQNIVGGTGGGLSVLKKDLGLSTGGQQGRISWREIIRPD
ncbi:MAG: PilC/PilY family type IV pilus protein, partial [Betaproteobacteria bacterium]|nr:PilC/PilY family type IV pilus protein [Betaproteobacteria bacterium]